MISARRSTCAFGLIVSLLAGLTCSAEVPADGAHAVFGIVMEMQSGTPDVAVCLCDATTGQPLRKNSYRALEWGKRRIDVLAGEMAIVVSDAKGRFRFDKVPDGKYRLIAQKWIGPYKGPFEVHGSVIQLMGASEEIVVPRPAEFQQARIALRPPGIATVHFDQEVPNNETFLLLSTEPPEFDPILGFHALGSSFWQHLVGVNRMPLGKTTVIGAPNAPLYAFFFAADSSPGYAVSAVSPSVTGYARVPTEPFVAGWSDGRKTPPPRLAKLTQLLERHGLEVSELLEIPQLSAATSAAYSARMQQLLGELSRRVELPEGQSARVGDLLAADYYRFLND